MIIILVAATPCQCQNFKGFRDAPGGGQEARLRGAVLSHADPQDARGHEALDSRSGPRDDVRRPGLRGRHEELGGPHGPRTPGDREEWHGLSLLRPQDPVAAPPRRFRASTWTTPASPPWTLVSSRSCDRSSRAASATPGRPIPSGSRRARRSTARARRWRVSSVARRGAVSAAGAGAGGRGVGCHGGAVGAAGRASLAVDEAPGDRPPRSAGGRCGPPGAGALWAGAGLKLAPQILGGGQEGGYRAGTENLPAIVGMGVAADLARLEGPAEVVRLRELRDRLIARVLERLPEARLTGARGGGRLPHHASFVVPGVKADGVLLELDLRGIAASSGSACNALTGEPSHVLRAIGCDREALEGSLCFTLGRWTTASEIDVAVETLPAVVARLRRLAPR